MPTAVAVAGNASSKPPPGATTTTQSVALALNHSIHVCSEFACHPIYTVLNITRMYGFFIQFPVKPESKKNTKPGETTPPSNLCCHDSIFWDTEMFRLPAKQNCWMWTFGWEIKRLRGLQKGSTSHIPGSHWIQWNGSDSLTTAIVKTGLGQFI